MQDLFSEFKPATAADWKNQIIKDLKGEDFNTLLWHNENGFTVSPFYTAEDVHQQYLPAFTHADWEICTRARHDDPAVTNAGLLRDLMSGATSVTFDQPIEQLETCLLDISLEFIHVTFFLDARELSPLKTLLAKKGKIESFSVSLFPRNITTPQEMSAWLEAAVIFGEYKGISVVSADTLQHHNNDATAAYELGMMFSLLVAQAQAVSGNGYTPNILAVRTGVDADYFIQIAKFRALRRLWEIFKPMLAWDTDLYIIAETSLTNKSISDNYNNLLRTTVEAMAAVTGGCNEVVVNEFDLLFPVNPGLSQRLAINQQLILKDEVYLDKMADISCGSYYIESLTDSLAEKALEHFKAFERSGGYFACLANSMFEKDISLQADARKALIATAKQVVVGVNRFRNESEQMSITDEVTEKLSALKGNAVVEYELEKYLRV
jgi:methylmalonyl-CoA mutase